MDRRFLTLVGMLSVATFGGLYLWPASNAVAGDDSGAIYYSGCNAVWAAGRAPLYRGQPGYREGMDGDGDGIACEPHRGAPAISAPGRWHRVRLFRR